MPIEGSRPWVYLYKEDYDAEYTRSDDQPDSEIETARKMNVVDRSWHVYLDIPQLIVRRHAYYQTIQILIHKDLLKEVDERT